jgi:small multidrug resistance pump
VHYIYLSIAIVSEVIGTSALKASKEFTQLWPSVAVVCGYVIAFYFLTLSLRHITVGIAYAIWAGLGIVLITLAGKVVYQQSLDTPAVLGMLLIICGVVVIHLFSHTAVH